MDVTMRITDINGQVMMARNYGNLYGDMLLTVPVSDACRYVSRRDHQRCLSDYNPPLMVAH